MGGDDDVYDEDDDGDDDDQDDEDGGCHDHGTHPSVLVSGGEIGKRLARRIHFYSWKPNQRLHRQSKGVIASARRARASPRPRLSVSRPESSLTPRSSPHDDHDNVRDDDDNGDGDDDDGTTRATPPRRLASYLASRLMQRQCVNTKMSSGVEAR